MKAQQLGKAGVKRMLSQQVKEYGPRGLWAGVKMAGVFTYSPRQIRQFVFPGRIV